MGSIDLQRDRFVVTGGAGFLGSFVCERLAARGVSAQRLVVPRRRDYDLTREADVERLYAEARPDVVIHLAAEVGGIGANQANPGRYFHANLAMGLHLIEHGRRSGIRKFVQIGTICAYPNDTPVPFREDDLWSGYPEETNAPYGIAKKALLVMCQAYRQQYGLNAIYLLPVNLYGPRDNFDLETSHVIPALIRKCLEAQRGPVARPLPNDSPTAGGGCPAGDAASIVCWGDGSPTREFLYVEDAAEGIVRATERYGDPDPVNLGTGREIAIRDLAQLIARLTGFTGRIEWDTTKPNGQPRRCLDVTRARERFGFVARTDFEEGLRRTIDWYRTSVEQPA
jgi:GDP-L-fucose synthase